MTQRFNKQWLTDHKADFLTWHKCEWCEPASHMVPGVCDCYGPDEYDEVDFAIIDDKGIRISYGDRELIMNRNPDSVDGFDCPFIKSGDLEWEGDDVDYYGPILHWLHDTFVK